MRTLLTIFCAGITLAITVPLWAQVPYDLSQAREFKTVWRMPLGVEISKISYNKDFGGKPDLHVITTFVSGRGRQTWSTYPKVDTTNLFNWYGVNTPAVLRPIDYDGTPPLEYINYFGIIWRCSSGESPFPLQPIDTVTYQHCIGEPKYTVDVDGDGYLDVVTDIGGDGKTVRVVMGGPQAGKGCERVFHIPQVHNRDEQITNAFFRSSSGGWKLVQWERDNSAVSPWLTIYDVVITREGGGLKASFVKRDSLYGEGVAVDDEPLGNCEAIVDTVTKKDWLLVSRRINGIPGVSVVERFDVTDGRFTSSGERVAGYEVYAGGQRHFGYSLGTAKPVIMMSNGAFCYADNIRQPFAHVRFKDSGLQPVSGMVAINDQTGDGKPDLVITGGSTDGTLALYTLDPAVSVPEELQPSYAGPTARMMGDVLEVTLQSPAIVSADLITTDGRAFPVLAPVQGSPGLNRYDLSSALRQYPAGAYRVRVRTGEAALTINVIR